jgi:hypothetical protein
MKKNAERFVHAIFCEDIRQEMGGKVSLMGCFQGDLLVPFLPVALPKLCVFVTVSTPVKRPLKALKIRIMQDDVELASLDVPEGATTVPIVGDGVTRFLANAAMVFSPFAIPAETSIRVLVVTEEGEIIGPRLRIKAMPEHATVLPGKPAAARKARKTPAKKPVSRRTPSK